MSNMPIHLIQMENKMKRKIHPQPSHITYADGNYIITNGVTVSAGEGAYRVLVDLAELYKTYTGFEFSLNMDKSLELYTIVFGAYTDTEVHPGGYGITVTDSGVTLSAEGEKECKWAVYTFLQLMERRGTEHTEAYALPLCFIKDAPKISFRGIHLCLFPETPLWYLEKTLTLAAFLKYTHVCLEFWGSVQLDAHPALSWNGRSHRKEEIRPILEKARRMGLEIIPMFNSLGHAANARGGLGKHVLLDLDPTLAPLFEPDGWTWCISNPATLQLLKTVRKELCDLCGEGSYFHVGCDEAHSFATCDVCCEKPYVETLTNYLNDIADEIKAMGRRPIIWSDQFLKCDDWPKEFYSESANSTDERPTHLVLNNLDKSYIIADWQYDIVSLEDEESCAHFMQYGFDTLTCPWYKPGNAEAMIESAYKNQAMGTMLTTWTELQNIFPRLTPLSTLLWGGEKEAESNICTLETANLVRHLMPSYGKYEISGWRNDRAF